MPSSRTLLYIAFAVVLTCCARAQVAPLGDLGDQPLPATAEVSAPPAPAPAAEPVVAIAPANLSERCREGDTDKRTCRFHWRAALEQSAEFTAMQTFMNMAADSELRYRSFHGKWIRNWFDAVSRTEWTRWNDGDPWYGNYVAHPMMGSVFSRIYLQNDPRGMALPISKSGAYWKSHLRAAAWTTAWEVQWELGPMSETTFGNNGMFMYYSESAGKMTNGTGLTDFITTPAAGFAWTVGEDLIDRYIITRIEGASTNRGLLLMTSLLNPARSMANILRLKAPYYRDTRKVR